MKKNKPYILRVPSAIVEVIDREIKRSKENFYFFAHYLYNKPLHNKKYENGYIPINRKRIKAVTSNYTETYTKFLKKYELIESDNSYIKGKKSLYYRIRPNILDEITTIQIMPETALYKRIKKNKQRERTNDSRMPEHLQAMKKKLLKLQYDYNGAEEWINSVPEKDKREAYQTTLIQLMDVNERYFRRNRTNYRLDTNLTNLKRELRGFIKGNFVCIDVKNSQPLLLSVVLSKIAEKDFRYVYTKDREEVNYSPLSSSLLLDTPSLLQTFGLTALRACSKIRFFNEIALFTNLSMFNDWCSSGLLYDNMVVYFNNQFSRDEVKTKMLAVLYSENEHYKREKKIFASLFPAINELIIALKRKDHETLAVLLQTIEARLFIDNIAKRLVENGIVPFTIHDSVIVEQEHSGKAEQIIKDVYREYLEVVPELKVENLVCK